MRLSAYKRSDIALRQPGNGVREARRRHAQPWQPGLEQVVESPRAQGLRANSGVRMRLASR